ncbi:MAG: endonuclease/exonuclease/phosphatase family protein [Planctomycetes bacterium]|nr:endonuclease/exonuclease/phosphatase family protein [Planctomycetota bacterium]
MISILSKPLPASFPAPVPAPRPTFRILTYNVHRCVGVDGRHDPARVAAAIREADPHIVALQELETDHLRTDHLDQPSRLAELLGMEFLYHPARERDGARFGNAILSRLPLRMVRSALLPTSPVFRVQRRAALWASVKVGNRDVQVINTHLGLVRGERMLQATDLCGKDWLTHAACAFPRILCGDFNATARSPVYRLINGTLRDAQIVNGGTSRPTWPSLWPFVRYDHVFVSPEISVKRAEVLRTRLTRVASDHLPVLVEFDVAPETAEARHLR